MRTLTPSVQFLFSPQPVWQYLACQKGSGMYNVPPFENEVYIVYTPWEQFLHSNIKMKWNKNVYKNFNLGRNSWQNLTSLKDCFLHCRMSTCVFRFHKICEIFIEGWLEHIGAVS